MHVLCAFGVMLSALLCGFILFSKCGLVVSLFISIVGPFFCIDVAHSFPGDSLECVL